MKNCRLPRSPKNWCVVSFWEDHGQTFSLIVADHLTEVEAIDDMIAREKAYQGTGRSFACTIMEPEP